MSNEEHLFENAIIALENKESYDKWLEMETKFYNTLGVSEEVIEVIWHLAIYTVYTHNPALEYDYNSKAIPIEWIMNKYREKWEKAEMGRRDFQFCESIHDLLEMWDEEKENWEKENEID